MRAVASRFDLKLYGRGWEEVPGLGPTRVHVYPKQYREICASTRVVLGVDARDDVHLYFSNRTWLTLGCGGFLLTRYVSGLEELFTNHEHLVWFRSTPEALELIDHYLRRDREREQIARTGYEYVHAYHTFHHATAEILGTTFGEPWHRAEPRAG
jgi:spore maturation protein CgeB